MTVPLDMLPSPRTIFYDRMDVNDLFRAENLAIEARNAMFAKLNHGPQPALNKTRYFGDLRELHMDNVRGTNAIARSASGTLVHLDRFNHTLVYRPTDESTEAGYGSKEYIDFLDQSRQSKAPAVNVSLPRIQSFVAVADVGQFRKAAERLRLSQPTITAHIRDLEIELGAPLFSRTTRNVSLTAEGANFLRRVRQVLAELDGAILEVREYAALHRGALVIAATPSVAANLLPTVIATFMNQHPGVHVQVLEDQSYGVEQRVESGEADLGVGPFPARRTDFSFSFLFRDRFVGVVPKAHILGKRARIRLVQLVGYPLLTTIPESSIRDSVKAVLDARGIALHSDHLIVQHQTVVQMVAAGLGVALLPSLALSRLDCSGIVLLRVDPEITRDIGILQRKGGSISSAAAAFLKAWPTRET